MSLALLIARLSIAALFLPSGIQKLWGLGPFTAVLRERGVPFAQGMAIVSAAAEIIAPVMLILGLAPRISAGILILFTIAATLVSHRFWTIADPAARAAQSTQVFKNLAIVGGLLAYGVAGAGAFSLARLAGRGRDAAAADRPEPKRPDGKAQSRTGTKSGTRADPKASGRGGAKGPPAARGGRR